jgi:hypothetical protein
LRLINYVRRRVVVSSKRTLTQSCSAAEVGQRTKPLARDADSASACASVIASCLPGEARMGRVEPRRETQPWPTRLKSIRCASA